MEPDYYAPQRNCTKSFRRQVTQNHRQTTRRFSKWIYVRLHTQDHIFSIRQIIGKFMDHNKEIYICYIDLIRVFDRVNRSQLWDLMTRWNIPNIAAGLVRAIKSIYNRTITRIRICNSISEEFLAIKVLRQGGNLSPKETHFKSWWDNNEHKKRVKGVKVSNLNMNLLCLPTWK